MPASPHGGESLPGETGALPIGLPRFVEATAAAAGLLLAAPLLLLSGLVVVATSRGPALFLQTRSGRGGRPFVLFKLRSMREASGPQVTARGDPRVTRFGRFLRRTKLDEVPQLWNVLRGEMSLVGPRPEVPRYVDLENPLWKRVLAVRPGMTDPVSLLLRNEEEILGQAEGDRERFYRETLLPFKLRGYVRYLARRSAWSDVRVLFQTLTSFFWRPKERPVGLTEILGSEGPPGPSAP